MTRLRSLIKEVLSQPKKKDCGCGCNDCGGKAPILTEGKFKSLISEGLQHHINKKISLFESVYRIGSEKHLELIREARALWVRGIIEVSDDDKGLLETHLGHFGLYEGVEVPLDLPMVNEGTFQGNEIAIYGGEDGETYIEKRGTGYYGYNNSFDFTAEDKADLKHKLSMWGYYPIAGSIDESLNEEKAKYRVEYTTQDGEKAKSQMYNSEEEANKKEKQLVDSGVKKAKVVKVEESLNEEVDEKVLSENQLDQIEDWKFQNGWGFIKDYRRENELGPNKKIAFLAYNSEGQKDLSKGQSLNVGLLDKLTPKIGQRLVNQLKADYLPSAMKITKDMIKQAGVDMVIVVDHNVSNNIINENNLLKQTNLSSEEYQKAKKLKGFNADDYTFSSDNNLYVKKSSLEERINTILEAKKKKKKEKKDPPLNKPKRGGSKAYYVYVRDPKTKKIKKVLFGSGGLRAKIKNKEARNAFAARHNCKNKKDRTKAGYWSCNLPRYAEQLGLGSKMNTFW